MEKSIFSEQWEKDAPLRKESLRYMQEHPLSSKEFTEQVKRNQEIRKQNMMKNLHRESSKKNK